jgi:hypothetical protein
MTIHTVSSEINEEHVLDTARKTRSGKHVAYKDEIPAVVQVKAPKANDKGRKTREVSDKKIQQTYGNVQSGKEEKSSSSQALAERKIVKLTPPKIDNKTIGDMLYCTRPMRDGKFQIGCETIDGKTVTHCYGHGGSGPTTLFGSVQQAIECFEKTNPSKEKPIRVIGAGVMGLTSAIELARRGYKVSISAKDRYEDMPSWKAAGYFALVSVQTSKEEQDNLNQIGMNTFLTYQQIEKGEHPYLKKETVRYLPVYCSEDTESGVEDLEKRGLIPPREYVTLDFQNGAIHPNFVKFMSYFINTTSLMKQLAAEVERREIIVSIEEIERFKEVEEDVIFNCTGLGARELNHDDKMIAVRGHLVALSEEAGSDHMDYMIYTKVKQNKEDRYVYMFPKDVSVTPENTEGMPCRAVLGGTFIPHTDKLSPEELETLDKKEMQLMLDRNSLFFTGKPYQPA